MRLEWGFFWISCQQLVLLSSLCFSHLIQMKAPLTRKTRLDTSMFFKARGTLIFDFQGIAVTPEWIVIKKASIFMKFLIRKKLDKHDWLTPQDFYYLGSTTQDTLHNQYSIEFKYQLWSFKSKDFFLKINVFEGNF